MFEIEYICEFKFICEFTLAFQSGAKDDMFHQNSWSEKSHGTVPLMTMRRKMNAHFH
jgi:hypothetical protein